MSNLPDESQKRFIAVLSKKMELGRSLNVLGHLSVGLASQLDDSETQYIDYHDMDGEFAPELISLSFYCVKSG